MVHCKRVPIEWNIVNSFYNNFDANIKTQILQIWIMIKTIRAGIGLIKVSICINIQWQSLNRHSNWHFNKAYPSTHKTIRCLIKTITPRIGLIKVSICIPIQWQSLNGDSNWHFDKAYCSAHITNKCPMIDTKVSITFYYST